MSIKSDLSNFVPEDGDYFQRWDDFAPLFDNFYILGPESFKSSCNPTCLFQYPITIQRIAYKTDDESSSNDNDAQFQKNSNYRDMNDQEFKSAIKQWEVIVNTDGGKITQFIFPDGIHFIENDQDYLSTDYSLVDTFSKPPKIQDSIIFIKSDGSIPHYYFCLRFRCSPFSLPSAFALIRSILITKLTSEGQNKNDKNRFNKDEVDFYVTKMKEKFEEEMIFFKNQKKCPTCLFAFIFETQHPCHDLYFNLIQLISRLETSKRTVALNLHHLLSSSYLKPISDPILNLKRKSDNDDDDFLIVEKIDNINLNDSIDCVISVKDSKELFQNSEDQIEANKDANKSNEDENDHDQIEENIIDNQIKENNKEQNEDNKNDNQNDEDANNKDQNETNKIGTKITDNKNNSFNIECDEINSDSIWPQNAFNARYNFLGNLYTDSNFPGVGEEMKISTGNSLLSKFVWKSPTTQESISKLCVYGIEPLLEWITLEDFVHILSLIFLEYDVIVAGTEVEPIVRIVSSFSHLIFPFAWMFPILTIVPDSFVDILGSPVPFIAGVFKSEKCVKKVLELDDSENILIIDIDDRTIKWPTQKHPKIACNDLYINSLKEFCTTQKKTMTQNGSECSHSNVLIIHNNDEKRKRNPFKTNPLINKIKSLNKNKKYFFFDPEKIDAVVDSVFKLNQTVFVSKIYPSIVTNIKNKENKCKVVGSMLFDELYVSQFEKNDFPFVNCFMKTQMFVSFREQSCKQKTDEESKNISDGE